LVCLETGEPIAKAATAQPQISEFRERLGWPYAYVVNDVTRFRLVCQLTLSCLNFKSRNPSLGNAQ